MTFIRFLFNDWSNVVYVAPFGIAVVYFTIAFLLGGGFGDADADLDADIELDADAGAEGHGDGIAHGDETEFFADSHDGAHAEGLFGKLFIFMGVGKAPLSLIWSSFFMAWGVAGITCNTALYVLTGPLYKILWFASLPVAFAAAVGLTRIMVNLWVRFLSTHKPTASTPRDLVGARGSVISESVTDDHGRARITDPFGFSLDIFCKKHPTCRKKLKHGDTIIVIDMVPGQNYYFVGLFDDEEK